MPLRTKLATVVLAAAAALALTANASAATSPPLSGVLADDLAPPLHGWATIGMPRMRPAHLRDATGLTLSGPGSIRRALPPRPWSLSLDLRLEPRSTLTIELGADRLVLARARDDRALTISGPGIATQPVPTNNAVPGWKHLEIDGGSPASLAIDAESIGSDLHPGSSLTLRATRGSARLTGLVATRRDDASALLLHRLAALHARTPQGRFPVGTGADDGLLRFAGGWTDGLWAGSLWRAYDLTRARLFRSWASAATTAHLGRESQRIHDQGFRYLESSAAAYDRTCRTGASRTTKRCRRLRGSGLEAADVLVSMAAENPGTRTIPTVGAGQKCRACASPDEAETIVDSVMNLGLLHWAHAQTHVARYRSTALAHALAVEGLLVRGDGSTAQGVRTMRSDGRVIEVEHRQGLSADSTWARGQAWAVYGYAQTGAALRRLDLVAVSERLAGYVRDHLPASDVPLYDYDAPAGSPEDTSAGVITAAGLFRLAAACERFQGTCARPTLWGPLARRMLNASLAHVSRRPPLGMLGDQVYSLGGSASWDDRGEYVFGLDYALEAIRRSLG